MRLIESPRAKRAANRITATRESPVPKELNQHQPPLTSSTKSDRLRTAHLENAHNQTANPNNGPVHLFHALHAQNAYLASTNRLTHHTSSSRGPRPHPRSARRICTPQIIASPSAATSPPQPKPSPAPPSPRRLCCNVLLRIAQRLHIRVSACRPWSRSSNGNSGRELAVGRQYPVHRSKCSEGCLYPRGVQGVRGEVLLMYCGRGRGRGCGCFPGKIGLISPSRIASMHG